MKNKFKIHLNNGNGITLVALVVTIIILLILAGIAISQLTNNGLFGKTQMAEQKYEESSQKEDIEISKYNNEINKYIVGNRDNTSISYSTKEQDTGLKWLDNKSIYQKTISITNNTTDTLIETDISSLNIDNVIGYTGIIFCNGYFVPIPHVEGENKLSIKFNSKSILAIYKSSKVLWTGTAYITIQYTKNVTTGN